MSHERGREYPRNYGLWMAAAKRRIYNEMFQNNKNIGWDQVYFADLFKNSKIFFRSMIHIFE